MHRPFARLILFSLLTHSGILAVFLFLMLTPTDRVMVGEGVVEVVVVGVFEDSTGTTDASLVIRRSNTTEELVASEGSVRHPGPSGNPTLTAIWKKINRAKYYPLVAREQKLEGAPRVQFYIGEDGGVANISLIHSSGSIILDDAALETIRRAAPLPSYPEPIILAIRYSLKDF